MDTKNLKKHEKNSRCKSADTPDHVVLCANTPKRPFLQQHISTPLQAIRERDDAKEEKKQPFRHNPFDVKAESLSFPACSPSIFATFSRNKLNKGTFRWSIEHLSFLCPADIDETSIQDPWVDPDQEVQAQKAIDVFFSQNSIVPSPWASDSSAQKSRAEIKLRRMSRSSDLLFEGLSNDVSTQTMLSIPPDADLRALLGPYFISEDSNENSACSSQDSSFRDSDSSNASSLRRKLFTENDVFTSPPQFERKDLYEAKQWCASTMRSLQSTPSDVLSSSPISPSNCSDFYNIPAISPHVSPIAAPSKKAVIRMQSFTDRLEEENMSTSSTKLSSQSMCTAPDDSMNFYMESEEAITCPSEKSEKQDTGYITGSMSSSHNITSEVTSSLPSQIPVAQFIKEWDISMSNANNISYMNECASLIENTIDQPKHIQSAPCNYKTWLKIPNLCSTPTEPSDL